MMIVDPGNTEDALMGASESSDRTTQLARTLTLALVLGVAVIGWPMWARAAGNVTVKQVGGELRIRGDREANLISLASEGLGEVVVGSFDPAGTINGGPGPFFAQGVEGITVSMGAGDDHVTLVDLFFTNAAMPGDVRIATGSANDTINAEDSSAGGLGIVTGQGNDVVHWDGGRCESLTIRTGAGADEVWISSFEVMGKALVHTGAGSDLISSFVQTFRDRVQVTTGAGDDTIALASSTFDGAASFNGGRGSDEFDEDQSTFNGGLTVENFEE
jgi:hypothetical protein